LKKQKVTSFAFTCDPAWFRRIPASWIRPGTIGRGAWSRESSALVFCHARRHFIADRRHMLVIESRRLSDIRRWHTSQRENRRWV